jgi:hypothetical protein
MYCDRCGTPFNSGSQYCMSCGKQLMAAAPAAAPSTPMAARAAGDGRVGRNINIVAGFWLANGILRLLGLGWWMIFRRLFFDGGWGWPLANWEPGFHSLMWGGLFAGGVFLGFFGLIHLLLAWGLYERQPWARVLGIVVACLALIRIPFGTALGIYTLWVLAPESSGREYDAMAEVGGRVNAARRTA